MNSRLPMPLSTNLGVFAKANLRLWLGTVLLFILSLPAWAALGGTRDSVEADQALMNACRNVKVMGSYSVHEIKAPTGTIVREYVSMNGRVFGVAWQGPFVPNMRQILGAYFEDYAAAAKIQRESRVGRRPLNIQGPWFVMQTVGHMLSYYGRAYDPKLLPMGVSSDDIR